MKIELRTSWHVHRYHRHLHVTFFQKALSNLGTVVLGDALTPVAEDSDLVLDIVDNAQRDLDERRNQIWRTKKQRVAVLIDAQYLSAPVERICSVPLIVRSSNAVAHVKGVLRDRCSDIWRMPFSFDETLVARNLHPSPEPYVMFGGCYKGPYPGRRAAIDSLRTRKLLSPRSAVQGHLPYKDYLSCMHLSAAGLACGTSYHMEVAKLYEIGGAGTALMTDFVGDAYPDDAFIPHTGSDAASIFADLLASAAGRSRLDDIRKRCHAYAWSHHTDVIRGAQLRAWLKTMGV